MEWKVLSIVISACLFLTLQSICPPIRVTLVLLKPVSNLLG